MAKRYPVLSRLDCDNTLYDPTDPSTPQTIVLEEIDADPLIEIGVLGDATGDATGETPEAGPKKGAKTA